MNNIFVLLRNRPSRFRYGMEYLRRSRAFARNAVVANTTIMTAGFMLIGFQLTGYFVTT